MFHRVQGSTNQFIRSTYDVETKRSKQKVVYSNNIFQPFDSADKKLADLTKEERDYLVDFFKTKEAAELDERNRRISKFAKDNVDRIVGALKSYPPSYEVACDLFESLRPMVKQIKSIKDAGMAKTPGIVAPPSEQDLADELDRHLSAK